MKRIVIGIIAIMALAVPVGASAAPVQSCGNIDPTTTWFTQSKDFGAGTFNVTTKVASCRTGLRVVLSSHRSWAHGTMPQRGWRARSGSYTFSCRLLTQGEESYDIRCTAKGGRVVRWQEGS